VFADGWIIRHHLDARWVTSPQLPEAALSDDGLDSTECTPARCPDNRELVSIPRVPRHTYFASLDARRDFNFWGVRHSVLTGLDLFASLGDTDLLLKSDPSLAVDLFNPVRAPVPWSLLQDPDSNLRTHHRGRMGRSVRSGQMQDHRYSACALGPASITSTRESRMTGSHRGSARQLRNPGRPVKQSPGTQRTRRCRLASAAAAQPVCQLLTELRHQRGSV